MASRPQTIGYALVDETSSPASFTYSLNAITRGSLASTNSVVQVHPDAASMEAHIAIVAERARAAYAETLDATVRIQVFGRPSEEMLAALKQQAGEGVVRSPFTPSTSGTSLASPARTSAAMTTSTRPEH